MPRVPPWVVLALLLPWLPGSSAAFGAGTHPAFSVGLSATPSSGAAPLQVAFQTTVFSGPPGNFSWSFGDGTYLNRSSAAGGGDPVHLYNLTGSFVATVTVDEQGSSSTTATAHVLIEVAASPLSVQATAAPPNGPVPLTVLFRASVAGGSGTYLNITWTFGDGGAGEGPQVSYTYQQAGTFHVTLNVTDANGVWATSHLNVTVASATPPPGMEPISWGMLGVVLIGGFLLGTLVVLLLLRSLRRGRPGPGRPRVEEDRPDAVAGPNEEGGPGPVPPAGPVPTAGEPPPSLEVPGSRSAEVEPPSPATLPATEVPEGRPEASPTRPGAGARTPEGHTAPSATMAITPRWSSGEEGTATTRPGTSAPGSAGRVGSARPTRETLRTSERVVLHLAAQGTLRDDEVATSPFTQAGMAEALQTRQNALTNVLRRLEAAGVLRVDVRHVSGRSRRLKVYRLSARGEALAHDLRSRAR